MADPTWKLATIKSTSFGNEDHGILTSYLHLAWPGGGQGFGGLGLGRTDAVPSEHARWTHAGFHPHLYRWMTGILRVMECEWEELPGKRLWFLSHHSGGLAIRSEDGKRIFWLSEKDADEYSSGEYPIQRPFT